MVRPAAGPVVLITLATLAACQPLYGNPPQRMKAPPTTPPPPVVAAAEPMPEEVLECDYDFHRDPKGVSRKPKVASDLVVDGDAQVTEAKAEDQPKVRASKVVGGMEQYRKALLSDPYHAEATLKLALQYDAFHRKGCALALLDRIGDLQTSPTTAEPAHRAADRVASNREWFKTYRNAALKAVNR